MSRDVEGSVHLTITKNSYAVRRQLANNSCIHHFLGPNFGSLLEFGQIADVDRREMLFERRIAEPALRHAAMQRHLTAFESALLAASRTRPHALVSAARRFAMA